MNKAFLSPGLSDYAAGEVKHRAIGEADSMHADATLEQKCSLLNRVGFDARWYNDSGVGTYVAELLQAMAGAKREFELVVYEDPLNRVPGLDDFSLVRIPVWSPRYSLSEQWEFRRRAREDRLDLLHSPFYVMPLAASCPVVVTVHDLIPFLFRIHARPKQGAIKAGYWIAARRAKHIISVSRSTACDLQNLLGVAQQSITVVHNGTSRDCFHPEGQDEDLDLMLSRWGIQPPYFVAASARNWPTKNLETALRAMQSVHGMTKIKFQVVVYGPPDGFLAAGGMERWPELSVVCPGHMPRADLARLFRHATAFVMPSLHEGFGLPVLEAMSSGCAVITSDRGSLPEIVAEGGQIFTPLDCAGMTRALAELLLDARVRQYWKARALRRAMDFSWAKAAQETIAVYQAAVGCAKLEAGDLEHRNSRSPGKHR